MAYFLEWRLSIIFIIMYYTFPNLFKTELFILIDTQEQD